MAFASFWLTFGSFFVKDARVWEMRREGDGMMGRVGEWHEMVLIFRSAHFMDVHGFFFYHIET